MSKVVFAAGTSHTPLLTFGAALWKEYSQRDTRNERLNLSDGSFIAYGDLLARVQARYGVEATEAVFLAREKICQAALSRIAAELQEAKPDVVLILTDDESELFSRANTPAVSIYYGDTIITRPFSSKMLDLNDPPPYFAEMAKHYAMDEPRSFPAMGDFGRELIEKLIERHIDIGAAGQVEEPLRAGFGHGIGFVIQRLFGGRNIPVIPILFNTYYPPNTPVPARCFDIGRALRASIDESTQDLRVALIASGGLSHFIVEEELDRKILQALRDGDSESLRRIPVGALNSGSSEIRNWIAMAGALDGLHMKWLEYQPIYRTPAGTGIGTAFGVWRDTH
jgi:hypothetical protein